MISKTGLFQIRRFLASAFLCGLTAAASCAARPADVSLIVRVSDCGTGVWIEGAVVRVPAADGQAGGEVEDITNSRGVARIYPLRPGGTTHEIQVSAPGYDRRVQAVFMKDWTSVEADICLQPSGGVPSNRTQETDDDLIKRMQEKRARSTRVENCQCMTYWSRAEMGRILPLGVAGLSPDLMIQESYFSRIPKGYGNWTQKSTAHSGDTVIIASGARMFLHLFTGGAFSDYTQLRPGHIGIIESAEYLDEVTIDLVGKHYPAFSGWRVRLRNANWPSEWMENNRFYAESVGDTDNMVTCQNVGVSEIIFPLSETRITFWGRY